MISQIFPIKFRRIHLTFISGHWMRFKYEICQTVTVISITSQFHEFFESHFWRDFANWPNNVVEEPSEAGVAAAAPASKPNGRASRTTQCLFVSKNRQKIFSLLKTSCQSFFDSCWKCFFFVLCKVKVK